MRVKRMWKMFAVFSKTMVEMRVALKDEEEEDAVVVVVVMVVMVAAAIVVL
jgi:hypothetical protein